MKKNLTTVILIIVFLAGLGLMMYPTVSDMINKAHQTVAIDSYEEEVSKLSNEDFSGILKEARKYNSALTTNEFPRNSEDLDGNEEYQKAMNPAGNGMMGYIKIDAINLKMPVYHTTKESVLQSGIGHIPTTSLPVGGESTHAVLTGHRGLSSARLFTDLDKLKEGDVFFIYVLDDILAYEVDQIKTVLPAQTQDLQIIEGEDHVTLVTCTPYGVNTHRLLIRGTRIPYSAEIEERVEKQSEVRKGLTMEQLVLIIGAPLLTVLFVIVLISTRKPKKRRDDA
ncbi:MAG: class C sortase [Ruminococcaceae bacterium]|nr:class C sortase [Oscillospiraceae bacterium]